MNFKKLLFFLCLICLSFISYAQPEKVQSLHLLDQARNRIIPVELYIKKDSKGPAVIINHGYLVKNTEYSFIANSLARQGYFVVSIQHDLENDPELPKTGNLFEQRKPFWERGAQNILFVMAELKNRYPKLDWNKIVLIGHSNGGDISMLFTSLYPELVLKVISLDSLRMPFPTIPSIPILSLRANDTKADHGVLPTSGVTIIAIKNAKHIDMCDQGPIETKQEIITLISKFLRESM